MLLGSKASIEDQIVEKLAKNPCTAKALWADLISTKPITIQAIYKELRRLRADGVIVKARVIFSLSREWVNRIDSLLNNQENLPRISNGESVTYAFNGLEELDKYWKHTIAGYIETLKGPIFHCEPHEIWIHLQDRAVSQKAYLGSFAENKRYGFLVFGGITQIDKEYKKRYQNDFLSIDLLDRPNFIKRNQYLTIIDDVIITTILSKSLSTKIDLAYENSNIDAAHFNIQIQEILRRVGRVQLRVEKNREKAKRIRKRLSKNFFILQDIVHSFDLF